MMIPAHTSQLEALAFDEEGEKLATASIKGTVIRVFSVATGDILFEFRRGVKRCVAIHCLSFNKSPELLLASSNTETIHIFKLCAAETVEPASDEPEGWMEMFGRVLLTQSTNYLPAQVSDVLKQPRSFAHVHLPCIGQKTVCSIVYIQKVPYVMAATLEGYLYIYDINMEVGGACHLVKQHRIEGPRHKPDHTSSSETSRKLLDNAKPLQSSPGADMDSTECLRPNVVSNPSEEDTPFLSCPNTESPELCFPVNGESELCATNGVDAMHEELPPLLTEVEQ